MPTLVSSAATGNRPGLCIVLLIHLSGDKEEELLLATAHRQRLIAAAFVLLGSAPREKAARHIPDFCWATHVHRLTDWPF